MSKEITATGVAKAANLEHGVADGAPFIEPADGEVGYRFEAGSTRIAVSGTPRELRDLAAGIVKQIDAWEELKKREA